MRQVGRLSLSHLQHINDCKVHTQSHMYGCTHHISMCRLHSQLHTRAHIHTHAHIHITHTNTTYILDAIPLYTQPANTCMQHKMDL